MRSSALPSHQYRDPMEVLSAKQEHQAKAEKRAEKRRTLTVRKEWSDARKAAESLFTNFAGSAVQPSESRCGAMPLDPDTDPGRIRHD